MKFPLIEKYMPAIRVTIMKTGYNWSTSTSNGTLGVGEVSILLAEDLERELGRGSQLFCTKIMTDHHTGKWTTENPRRDNIHGVNWNTHAGLFIGIQPIEKELSAQSLLEELVGTYNGYTHINERRVEVLDRARKFLERNKK